MKTDPKIESVIRKIEALLNTKGCTEAEAQARVEKAQELLAAYNLDMATIGAKADAPKQKRDDKRRAGGLYNWQRELWQAVARLNFCHYIAIKGAVKGQKYEHRLVGSPVNVLSTELMAEYLQTTMEKLGQQWARDNGYNVFARDAIMYREGMSCRVVQRLNEKRDEVMAEARRQEQANKANQQSGATSTALTILDVISSEDDLNNDYMNGWEPGTTARNRKAWEDRMAAARAEREKWERENPEEAAAEKERLEAQYREYWERERKRQAKNEKRRKGEPPRERAMTKDELRAQMPAFQAGVAKGDEINFDKQIDEEERKRINGG